MNYGNVLPARCITPVRPPVRHHFRDNKCDKIAKEEVRLSRCAGIHSGAIPLSNARFDRDPSVEDECVCVHILDGNDE